MMKNLFKTSADFNRQTGKSYSSDLHSKNNSILFSLQNLMSMENFTSLKTFPSFNSLIRTVVTKPLKPFQLFIIPAFISSFFVANAQEMNVRPAEMSLSAKGTSSALTTEQSALNPELKELGIKINLLLNQVRTQLADAANKQWFSENLQSSLSAKSAQVCPNIALVDLMLSTESFILTQDMEKQELLHVIDFLNVSINGMLTK